MNITYSPDVRAKLAIVEPEQEPEGIRGDLLLNLLHDWIGIYAKMPEPALDLVTLWAAHTHFRDAEGSLIWRATPRLYVLSKTEGSGKSQVLELLNLVCPNTFGLDIEPTQAGLVYTLNQEKATALIDEGDVLFGSGSRKSGVRAVLNAGYTRSGSVLTGRGGGSRSKVFGPVAIAALDSMETGTQGKLRTLLSRGIKIRMQPAGKNRPAPWTNTTESQGAEIKSYLQQWAAQDHPCIYDELQLPPELEDRKAQISLPLAAVAAAAGGDWPFRFCTAIKTLLLSSPSTAPAVNDRISDLQASLHTPLQAEKA
jgi:hypothetical protein